MTADRQSGLTQQPSSEQNGAEVEVSAEADAVAERKDNVSVIPMKVGGVDVRDRRTAEARQAENTITCATRQNQQTNTSTIQQPRRTDSTVKRTRQAVPVQ